VAARRAHFPAAGGPPYRLPHGIGLLHFRPPASNAITMIVLVFIII
jgi:hypothetical protein